MIKKLMLATIASMVLVSGMAGAGRPDRELQTFNVLMFGAITTSTAGVESGPANLGNNQRLIDFSLKPFNLENYWREHSYETAPAGGGKYCFPENEIGDSPYIQIYEKKGGGMEAVFYFRSPPENEIKYMLTLTDDQGSFPDVAVGEFFDLEFEAWVMETEGRGQKRKSACTDTGPDQGDGFVFTMTITRIE